MTETVNHIIEYTLSDKNMDYSLITSTDKKTDRDEVKDLILHRDEVANNIRDDVRNRKLKPLIHRGWFRKDGIKQKERLIVQPYFTRERPEQWIDHIAMNVLKPIIMKGAYYYSCGSVTGKGTHFGKKYLKRYIERHPKDVRYCMQLDIKKFYNNVDTDILKYKLEQKIKDKDFLYILNWIIDNNVVILPDGKVVTGGLVVGTYPAQYFANFYLQEFDHYVKEQLKAKFYMRYMDDMIILGSNKRELRKMLTAIRGYLRLLHLELSSNYQIYKFDFTDRHDNRRGRAVDFMGFRFFRDKTTIRKKIFLRACRTARKAEHGLKLIHAQRIISYKGWFDDTDSYKAYHKHITGRVPIRDVKQIISENSKGGRNGNKIRKLTQQHISA